LSRYGAPDYLNDFNRLRRFLHEFYIKNLKKFVPRDMHIFLLGFGFFDLARKLLARLLHTPSAHLLARSLQGAISVPLVGEGRFGRSGGGGLARVLLHHNSSTLSRSPVSGMDIGVAPVLHFVAY